MVDAIRVRINALELQDLQTFNACVDDNFNQENLLQALNNKVDTLVNNIFEKLEDKNSLYLTGLKLGNVKDLTGRANHLAITGNMISANISTRFANIPDENTAIINLFKQYGYIPGSPVPLVKTEKEVAVWDASKDAFCKTTGSTRPRQAVNSWTNWGQYTGMSIGMGIGYSASNAVLSLTSTQVVNNQTNITDVNNAVNAFSPTNSSSNPVHELVNTAVISNPYTPILLGGFVGGVVGRVVGFIAGTGFVTYNRYQEMKRE